MSVLKTCKLFDKFNDAQLAAIDEQHIVVKNYHKANYIAHEGDICKAIGIVMAGNISLQTLYPSGKVVTHLRLSAGGVFGEALLFNEKNHYPLNVSAISDCQIGFIKKQNLLIIFKDYPQALNNYLMLMSNKLLLLNKKIHNLSLDTLDKRIANFLLQTHRKTGNRLLNVGISRKAMAEMMGVQRPSLSRTLSKMRQRGIIDYAGDSFKIIDLTALENILTQ